MKEKNTKSKQSQILRGLPVWNLVDLYPSISSKKIQTDLNFIRKESKFFEKKYHFLKNLVNLKKKNNN